jgi:hypothetical protein
MADIPIQWNKVTRGLPRGKKYADDRIPTLEELKKLVDYPDRRITCTSLLHPTESINCMSSDLISQVNSLMHTVAI